MHTCPACGLDCYCDGDLIHKNEIDAEDCIHDCEYEGEGDAA